ncbi:hypothetical protein HLB44_01880 [Aquincola sp. S2]|uniref:Uncharacterized protein n=1 Tax=Pseudaquabacterium terrae TaxID=2732868 RepID=A0ABX2EB29_9BURK|nr:hypothetical protein [Aquabacterium terrae]NRF65726.1 hypothetical protein [Aquabacterium terrae]
MASPLVPFVLGRALAGSIGVVDDASKNRAGLMMMMFGLGLPGIVVTREIARRDVPPPVPVRTDDGTGTATDGGTGTTTGGTAGGTGTTTTGGTTIGVTTTTGEITTTGGGSSTGSATGTPAKARA